VADYGLVIEVHAEGFARSGDVGRRYICKGRIFQGKAQIADVVAICVRRSRTAKGKGQLRAAVAVGTQRQATRLIGHAIFVALAEIAVIQEGCTRQGHRHRIPDCAVVVGCLRKWRAHVGDRRLCEEAHGQICRAVRYG